MGYKILGVTLARSGSKGVKQKNIKNLCGHPLLSYTIYAAKKSKLISRYVVSTNSKKFKNICLNYGADVPFLRPEKLSKDNVWSRDALKHAVINSEKYYKEKYDYVVELPATAPLRDYRDIDKAINKLIKKKSDSVIGVSRVLDKHPVRIKKISNGKLDDYNKTLKEGESSRRQDLPSCYVRNGSIYAMKRNLIVKKFSRKGKISLPHVMDSASSINIDENIDFYLAETLIKKGYSNNFPASIFCDQKVKLLGFGKIKILVSYPYIIFEKVLKNMIFKNVQFVFCEQKNIFNLKNEIKDNVFAWITSTNGEKIISNKTINNFKNLKHILSPSTGLTHISSHLDKKIKIHHLDKNIVKKIMASSEFSIGQIINLSRNTLKSREIVKEGNWRNKEILLRGHELGYFKFGIFGLGRIGKNIAKFLNLFNYDISYFDPYIKTNKYKKYTKISNFLRSINFLIVTAKLTKETKFFFDKKKLNNLKKYSRILNISRGEIFNQKDLQNIIKKKFFIFGTDVLSEESSILKRKNSFINYSRVNDDLVITPHMAGLTYESETKSIMIILKKLKKILNS